MRFDRRWRPSVAGPAPGTVGIVDRQSPVYAVTVDEAQTLN
jgi:hypothetical protein